MTSNATVVPQGRPAHCSSRRWSAILPWLAVVPMLTSCAHGTKPTPAIPPELLALTVPLPPIGADLTAPCPAQLPPALDDSLAGLGRNHLASAALYHDCKDGKRRLADAVRERERIERERIERARRTLEDRGSDRD